MKKLAFNTVLIMGVLLSSCGSETSTPEDEKKPAMAVPSHIITERDSERVIEAESGDTVVVRLSEPMVGEKWRQLSAVEGLNSIGAGKGEIVEDDEGRFRQFRYQTQIVGEHSITFVRDDPDNKESTESKIMFRILVL